MTVVDTSVALKWLRRTDEKHIHQALLLLKGHLGDNKQITVPDLLFIEVANALATKTDTDNTQIKKDLKKLFEVGLKTHYTTKEELLKTSLLAKKHKTSVYDMLYAVIAKEHKTTLYTADKNFISKTKFKHVKHISEVELKA